MLNFNRPGIPDQNTPPSGNDGNDAASQAAGAGSSPEASAVVASIRSQHFNVLPVAGQSNVVAIANGGASATVAFGGPAVTIGSQIVGAAPSGHVVVGIGDAAVTVTPGSAPSPNVQPVVAVVGSQHFTISRLQGQGGDVQVLK